MLKVDCYVKIVLTVIAICLMVIAFRPMFNTPAIATEAGGEVTDVNIVSVAGHPISPLMPVVPIHVTMVGELAQPIEVWTDTPVEVWSRE